MAQTIMFTKKKKFKRILMEQKLFMQDVSKNAKKFAKAE